MSTEQLLATLQAIAANGLNERIFVRGDRAADYGTMMKVIARLDAAGYKRIGLVSLPDLES